MKVSTPGNCSYDITWLVDDEFPCITLPSIRSSRSATKCTLRRKELTLISTQEHSNNPECSGGQPEVNQASGTASLTPLQAAYVNSSFSFFDTANFYNLRRTSFSYMPSFQRSNKNADVETYAVTSSQVEAQLRKRPPFRNTHSITCLICIPDQGECARYWTYNFPEEQWVVASQAQRYSTTRGGRLVVDPEGSLVLWFTKDHKASLISANTYRRHYQ